MLVNLSSFFFLVNTFELDNLESFWGFFVMKHKKLILISYEVLWDAIVALIYLKWPNWREGVNKLLQRYCT